MQSYALMAVQQRSDYFVATLQVKVYRKDNIGEECLNSYIFLVRQKERRPAPVITHTQTRETDNGHCALQCLMPRT